MKRLVDALSNSEHRVVVSKGPQHASYDLPANMWGAEFLPQTRLLPEVDLVISHGGNNTVTEALHFGKPMIVLPLFWTSTTTPSAFQETGLGLRLAPYEVTPHELNRAVDGLLGDGELRIAPGGHWGGDPGCRRRGAGGEAHRRSRLATASAVTAPDGLSQRPLIDRPGASEGVM